jgi:isoleucyl-tRNA synthetase
MLEDTQNRPFDPVDPKQSFPALEHGILQYWREEDTFKRSVKQRMVHDDKWDSGGTKGKECEVFSFYDGPPFATGLPHYGHLLAGTIKDVIPRYQTMRGKRVDRRFGWDCHGLPIENLVEKEHDIKDKSEIEKKGVRWFIDLCRGSVQRYTSEWRQTVERMGRWVDMDWDYRTMDPDYMESIWWAFAELHKKGLIYEGKKSMHICPRCVTPLSNFEVTLGYKEVPDWTTTSIFPLTEDPNTALLAWTTTSWTLPGNLFLAIGKDITYVRVKVEGDERKYIVAEPLVESVFKDHPHEVVGKLNASELVGKSYEPLFPYFAEEYKKQKAFRIVEGDFVTTEEGTGVVHIATGFGTDDYEVGKREGTEVLSHVTMNGQFIDEVVDFAGQDVKPFDDPAKTDKKIAAYLKDRGRLFSDHSYKHSYPHCWRCDSPLINYATSSWFVAVEKIKKDLIAQNERTHWVPQHVRDGRFGEWLKNARDWAISRSRYWGTPLPIWRCEETGEIEVIGSRDELRAKCTDRFTKITVVRHGESEGNIIPIYQGEVPGTPLTRNGKKQAKAVAKSLGAQNVDVIYTSPLARAKETAEIIGKKTGTKPVVNDHIREIHFGEYEGKTIDFSDLTFVKEIRAKKIEKGKPESIYHFEGMETWDETKKRIVVFFEEILPRHKGQHIVIVSHADPINNMRHFFTGEDPVKISHQPYPEKAEPHMFFWDHERGASLDLHKDTVDELTWTSKKGGTMVRVPEVLDCWFESGSMPYAQAHFPFEGHTKEPADFPASFIAENLDQTRGWFYTLMVLSTALFKKPAFWNCICGGMILAEDGKKMSKRLKNYPDPNELMERNGADALRFSLMASPVVRAQEIRFSEKPVEETVRRVILPLWNVYSFFVLHANEAGWQPDLGPRTKDLGKSLSPKSHVLSPLDEWIKAEVQDLVNRMTEQLDRYDLSATCSELYETLDALTNWYIRRSRRRFAGKEGDEARQAALSTLYEVLITFSQVLAPFCPFITEAIYLNLVTDDHGSIHLSDWPETKKLSSDDLSLIKKTRLLRSIVSLGMGLRGEANVKVRQPLLKVEVALSGSGWGSGSDLSSEDQKVVREELNVKELRILSDASHLADRIVQVDARKVGPRLGGKVQEIIKAAKEGNYEEKPNGTIIVLGEKLSADEAQVVYQGKEGQAVASEKGIIVSLDTELSEGLKLEGLARDVIRSVQSLRKEKGLKVSDHISLEAGEGTSSVIDKFKDIIESETNGVFGGKDGVLQVQVKMEDGAVVASV